MELLVNQQSMPLINLIENKMTSPVINTVVTNAPTSGYWITINKSSNTLTLLKGKQVIENFL